MDTFSITTTAPSTWTWSLPKVKVVRKELAVGCEGCRWWGQVTLEFGTCEDPEPFGASGNTTDRDFSCNRFNRKEDSLV